MITPSRPYTFDRVMRIVFTVLAFFGIFYIINLLKGALLPFVVAWLLAYLLNPMVLFFQNKVRIRNRLLAIVTTLTVVVGTLVVIGLMLAPSIMTEVDKTAEVVKNLSHSSNLSAVGEKAWYQSLLDKINIDEITRMMKPEEWSKLIENTFSHAWDFLTGSINQIITIVGWFIVLLYLVFILLDYDKIISGFRDLIPQRYREITFAIMKDVEDGMNRYFRGQSLVALLVGILFSIGFVIIGLPLAVPLGLFIGLLNLVPYLQIVGILPTILLCIVATYDGGHTFWGMFGLSMVVFAVVQTIQDVVITPKIMGHVTGLNPAVILLSLSIWGTLMGVMGMIIALPLTSILLSYYQKYIVGDVAQESADESVSEMAAVEGESESEPVSEN